MKKSLLHIVLFMVALFLASCQSSGESDDTLNTESNEFIEQAPFSAAYVQNSEEEISSLPNSMPEAEETDGRIESSRVNAITRSVEKGSGAVVSIMATEPIKQQDPTRDEFFRFFFGDQFPRENTSMGSGFIIS